MNQVTQLAGEKQLRRKLEAQFGYPLKLPLLLMTPHGDVRVLLATIEGTRPAIAWAARHYGKAAA